MTMHWSDDLTVPCFSVDTSSLSRSTLEFILSDLEDTRKKFSRYPYRNPKDVTWCDEPGRTFWVENGVLYVELQYASFPVYQLLRRFRLIDF